MTELLQSEFFSSRWRHVDWILVVSAVLLSLLGLVTMNSFTGASLFFGRQAIWITLSLVCMFGASYIDTRMFYRSGVVFGLYAVSIFFLVLVLLFGTVVLGAQNRFDLGFFAFQPSDPAQLALILVLAKYFTRRHLEIAHIKHILVSGAYMGVICILLFLQPDFGSAVIVFSIWLGMVLIAGISRTHLVAVFALGIIGIASLWMFAFADYQKTRILTFLHPLADIQGAGYNAYQSTIAVGSGGVLGKGIGYGSQSKLEFLPEYETDFIFAAFAEEWGYVGVLIMVLLFGVLSWRLLVHARYGSSNFETLACAGIIVWFLIHIVLHVGMNVGLMPVAGTTLPFLSYGGSHMVMEFVALGLVLAMSRYERSVRLEELEREVRGLEGV
ncbi:MAG: rod shape-determining protein RodA [Candidatus Pacebacteria bacterium]|nr:rod shape-determining protein RodA [Candidatus Paceibacterota bacterium]